MRRTPLIFLSLLALNGAVADAGETELLSSEKQRLLHEEQKRYEAEHEKLRTNWIAPVNLSGSYSHDKSATGMRSESERLSASVSQDIFRSGGITYQIRYADAKRNADAIGWDRDVGELNRQLFTALLHYHKSRYELEQSRTKLANHDIEIFIKRQLYEAGKADITELNNALMERSGEQKSLAAIEYALADQRAEIAKVSNIDPEAFAPSSFELVQEEEYAKKRFDIRYARAQGESYENLYRLSFSSYLPSVALEGSTGYMRYDRREEGEGDYDGLFYSVGASVRVPLTYNASATIQEAKATYLKQIADTADREREARADYGRSLELIESYRRTIAIAEENLRLYDELIRVVAAGVDAGSKTGYDLQTLNNTKAIEEYAIKINETNIQLELAKLYFALNAAKEIQ